jgi:hypothetical protein
LDSFGTAASKRTASRGYVGPFVPTTSVARPIAATGPQQLKHRRRDLRVCGGQIDSMLFDNLANGFVSSVVEGGEFHGSCAPENRFSVNNG